MISYLANIFQGRIEYELIYSLRGTKIQPKTTFFAHLRDLRLGKSHNRIQTVYVNRR